MGFIYDFLYLFIIYGHNFIIWNGIETKFYFDYRNTSAVSAMNDAWNDEKLMKFVRYYQDERQVA